MNKTGLFFALEGIDGSGKSTQIKKLAEKISQEHPHLPTPWKTHEPTSSPLGKHLRDILSGNYPADPRVVSALFATDRLQHILDPNEGILEAMEKGQTVLTDRYYFSSYAYHSVEQDLEKIIAENAQNAQILRPTATIYLDLSPQQAMERICKRQETPELYENLTRLQAVHDNYKKAFARLEKEETIILIQADQTDEQVAHDIWNAIAPYF